MFDSVRTHFFFAVLVIGLYGCGDAEAPEEKAAATEVGTSATTISEMTSLPNGVIYQEQIYKDWPYTEVALKAPVTETEAETTTTTATDTVPASDKPYQIADGKPSANVIEGWKTYNGGGCGACHGKGAIGAVGPNLGQSVTQKLSKDEFVNIVTNGKPGTMMRPHNTNKRVMDNLDNLYAYLVARGDDAIGPGNLIKLPLGK